MRLVLVHDRIGGSSGMGRVVGWAARTALDASYDVTLVADFISPELEAETNTIRVRAARGLPSLADNLTWCAAAGRALRRLRADIVHVHLPALLKQSTVMTCHHLARATKVRGMAESGTGIRKALRTLEAEARLRLDDRFYSSRSPVSKITFVSDLLHDEFITFYGEPQEGSVIFPPAPRFVPVSAETRQAARRQLGVATDKLVVGYLGGNDPRKGYSAIVALAEHTSAEVLVAGPHLDGCEVPGARVVGYVNPRELIEASDVIAAPAVFDAAPVAVGQALSRGVPTVVGAANGWAASIRRHGAGTVWNGDADLAAAVLAASRAQPEACRSAVEEVSEERQAAKLLALYERSVGA